MEFKLRSQIKLFKLLRALLVVALFLGLLAGCREELDGAPDIVDETVDQSSEEKAPVEDQPIQQFFDYQLVESNAGIRQWVLDSDLMNKYAGQKDAELIGVHLDFFKDGSHFSVLTADSGSANLKTNDIFTWGNVVVITDDGRRLETEELYFSNEKQIIHNEVFDRFTRDGDVVLGIGLEATPDLQYIEIKQKVEADVLDSENTEGETR